MTVALAVNDNDMTTMAGHAAVRNMTAMSSCELRRLMTHAAIHLQGREGTMGVTSAMGNILNALPKADEIDTSLQGIALRIAIAYDVTVDDLRAPSSVPGSSTPSLSAARHHAFYLCWRVTGGKHRRYSLPRIGQFFGGRDHTTVLFGVRRHEARLRAELV